MKLRPQARAGSFPSPPLPLSNRELPTGVLTGQSRETQVREGTAQCPAHTKRSRPLRWSPRTRRRHTSRRRPSNAELTFTHCTSDSFPCSPFPGGCPVASGSKHARRSHTAGKEERALSGPETPRAWLLPRLPSPVEPLAWTKECSKRWFWPLGPLGALKAAPEGSWLWLESDGREAGPSLSDTSREVCPSAAPVGRVTKVGMEPRYETKLETCVSRVGRVRYSSSLSTSSSDFHPDSVQAACQTPWLAPFSLSALGKGHPLSHVLGWGEPTSRCVPTGNQSFTPLRAGSLLSQGPSLLPGALGVDASWLQDVNPTLPCFWGTPEGHRIRLGSLGLANGRAEASADGQFWEPLVGDFRVLAGETEKLSRSTPESCRTGSASMWLSRCFGN